MMMLRMLACVGLMLTFNAVINHSEDIVEAETRADCVQAWLLYLLNTAGSTSFIFLLLWCK